MRALAVDPSAPDTLYAGTTGGVFKSLDAGHTWTALNKGLTNSRVYALAVDPAMPARVYAATQTDVFKSVNGGHTWTSSLSIFPPHGILALAIDPLTPTRLYAGTAGKGVFRSTDGGGTWSPANAGLSEPSVSAFAIDPTNPARLYAGTYNRVFKSTDGGTTWSALPALGWRVTDLALDPADASVVYAATSGGGVLRSDNGGATWAPVNTGLETLHVNALAIPPLAPDTLYAATDPVGATGGGIFKTTNGGATWSALGLAQQSIAAMAVGPSALYAAAWPGVFKSTDAGGTWAPSNTGLTALGVTALVAHPVAPSPIYAKTPLGLLKSIDGGATWANIGPDGNAMAIDPSNPDTIYVDLQKTTDGGNTWQPLGALPPSVYIESLAVDPVTSTTVYAGTWLGVFKSTDSGATWVAPTSSTTCCTVRVFAIDPTLPSTLYVGTDGAVYKSTDAGVTWSRVFLMPSGGDIMALVIDPSMPSTLYAGARGFYWAPHGGGVFKSTDAGATWTRVNAVAHRNVTALAIDPAAPTTLYAGTGEAAWHGGEGSGVLRSTDGGSTWTTLTAGLPNLSVDALAVGPATAPGVYAGLRAGGLWKLTPAPPKGDLDRNGSPDLVFGSLVDGTQHLAWLMDGTTRLAEQPIVPDAPGPDWLVCGVDDFNADTRADLVLWNQTTGDVDFWLMDGTGRVGAPARLDGTEPLPVHWELAATADFNNDGWPDLVWRDSASQKIVIWTMYGTTMTKDIVPVPDSAVDANWAVVGALDYNADGHTDFLWYNRDSGKLVFWFMDAAVQRIAGQFANPSSAGDNNWRVVAAGDYGVGPGGIGGTHDVVWRNATSGKLVVWHMDNAGNRTAGTFTSPDAPTPPLDWTVVGPR